MPTPLPITEIGLVFTFLGYQVGIYLNSFGSWRSSIESVYWCALDIKLIFTLAPVGHGYPLQKVCTDVLWISSSYSPYLMWVMDILSRKCVLLCSGYQVDIYLSSCVSWISSTESVHWCARDIQLISTLALVGHGYPLQKVCTGVLWIAD